MIFEYFLTEWLFGLLKTVTIEAECLPKKVVIPLNYGLQLKIVTNTNSWVSDHIGIGNMQVQ